MSTRRINDLLNLSHVTWWHTVSTRRKASVAEHSYRVAALTMELCDRLEVPEHDAYRMVRWALVHDGPESETGDLPRTTKRRLPKGVWREIESFLCPWSWEANYPLVTVADLMDAYLFISNEQTNSEGHNAEVTTREQLYAEIDAIKDWPKKDKSLDRIVWDIIAESRLPSDTRHAIKSEERDQSSPVDSRPSR